MIKDNTIDVPVQMRRLISDNGILTIPFDINFIRLYTQRQSSNYLNYRDAISKHLDATTPMNAIRTSLDTFNMPAFVTYSPAQARQWQDTYFGLAYATPVPGGSVNNAIAKCYNNVNSYVSQRQNPFNSQVFLGEFKETMEFVHHPFKRLTELVTSEVPKFYPKLLASKRYRNYLKKKIPGTSKRLSKELTLAAADSWLELRFALLPLISDVNSILDEILGLHEQATERNRFYAKTEQVSRVERVVNDFSAVAYDVVDTFTDRQECIVRIGLETEKVHALRGLGEALKGNLDDLSEIVPTIWEITPMSFLVDYFVNVGEVLNSHINVSRYASYVCQTTINSRIQRSEVTGWTIQPGVILQSVPPANKPVIQLTHSQLLRQSISDLVPPLVFKVPASDIKLANLAALSVSTLLRSMS